MVHLEGFEIPGPLDPLDFGLLGLLGPVVPGSVELIGLAGLVALAGRSQVVSKSCGEGYFPEVPEHLENLHDSAPDIAVEEPCLND